MPISAIRSDTRICFVHLRRECNNAVGVQQSRGADGHQIGDAVRSRGRRPH